MAEEDNGNVIENLEEEEEIEENGNINQIQEEYEEEMDNQANDEDNPVFEVAFDIQSGVGYKFSFLEQWKGSKTIRLNMNPKYYKSILGVARPIGEPYK